MFCYLLWFPEHRRNYVMTKFGPNPLVSDVLFQLYIDYEGDYLLLKPTVTGPDQLHINIGHDTFTLNEAILTYIRTFFRIGHDGYCYLEWFHQSGIPEWKTRRYRRRLGSYPLLQDVFSILIREVPNLKIPISIYRPTRSYGVVHVYPDEQIKKPFCDVLHASRHFMKMRFLIGTTGQMTNLLSRKLLAMGGINQEDVIKQILQKKLENPNSDESNNVIRALSDIVYEQINKPKTVVYIRVALSALQQSRLSELYPEFNLDFSKANSYRAHSMAAAMRQCNVELMLIRCGYSNKEKVPPGFDAWVKDVGGNLRMTTARSWYSVHCCIPVLDVRDNARRSAELMDVRSAATKNPELAKVLSDSSDKLFCRSIAQQCGIRAPFMIMNDSQYDMTNKDVADAMDAAGAELAYSTILFEPEILMAEFESGEMQDVGMIWKKKYCNSMTKDAVREGDRYVSAIRFYFRSDYSLAYEHSYRTYIEAIVSMKYVSTRNILYIGEIVESRGPYLVLKIIRTRFNVTQGTISYTVPISKKLKNSVIVQYYTYEPLEVDTHNEFKVNFTKRRMLVPRNLYESGLKYALAQTQQKFSVNAIYEYLRSVSVRVVVNGTDASIVDVPVESLDLYHLADSIYLVAFVQRYNSSTALAIITDYLKRSRHGDGSSLFMRVLKKIFSGLVGSLPMVSNGIPTGTVAVERHDSELEIKDDSRSDLTLLQKLSLWAAAPTYFDIKICDATKVIEIVNVIDAVIYDYNQTYFAEEIRQVEYYPDVVEVADNIVKETLNEFKGKEVSPDLVSQVEFSIQPAPEFPYRTHSCKYSDVVQILDVPGDGNCLFHSLKGDLSVQDLKRRLLESKFLNSCLDIDEVIDILTSGNKWGNDDIILLYCREFQCNVCLHNYHNNEPVCYLFQGSNSTDVNHHIVLRDNHFAPLNVTVKGGAYDAVICPEIFRTVPPPSDNDVLGYLTCLASSRQQDLPSCAVVETIGWRSVVLLELFDRYPEVRMVDSIECSFDTRVRDFFSSLTGTTGNGTLRLFGSFQSTNLETITGDDVVIIEYRDWSSTTLVEQLESLSQQFGVVIFTSSYHAPVIDRLGYVVLAEFGLTCTVRWETTPQNLFQSLQERIIGNLPHECQLEQLRMYWTEFVHAQLDSTILSGVSIVEFDDSIMEEVAQLSECDEQHILDSIDMLRSDGGILADVLESGFTESILSPPDLYGGILVDGLTNPLEITEDVFDYTDVILPPPNLYSRSSINDCELSLRIAGKSIFYHSAREFDIGVSKNKNANPKYVTCNLRFLFTDHKHYAFRRGDCKVKDVDSEFNDLLIKGENLFCDKIKFYKTDISKMRMSMLPATERKTHLGLIKTKVSSDGLKIRYFMGVPISQKQVKTPTPYVDLSIDRKPLKPVIDEKFESLLNDTRSEPVSKLSVTLPTTESRDRPIVRAEDRKDIILTDRDKSNLDRVGSLNKPVNEVPILSCKGEVRDPSGIECVFIDSKGKLMTNSLVLTDGAVLNVYNTYKGRNMLSGGNFVTVLSGSTLVCIVGFETAELLIEFSNFVKIMGCLYPESRLFYVNELSKFITIPRLTGIMDNFVGFYPHRFVTIGECKDDCTYVSDHYNRFNRAVQKVTTAEQSVMALWERTNSGYSKFNPRFEAEYIGQGAVRNSAREILEYWRISSVIVYNVYKEFYDMNCRTSVLNVGRLRGACDLSPEKFRVVKLVMDPNTQEVKISPIVASSMSDGSYEAFFDGVKIVQWEDIRKGNVAITDRYYLTGKSLKLMQAQLLFESCKDTSIDGFSTEYINVNFIQGVPGCGKTHCIVENVPLKPTKRLEVEETHESFEVNSCLILTPTRESADEIKTRLSKRGISKDNVKTSVATIDSYLLNHKRKGNLRYDLLIVEEALMLHAGQVVLALILSGARSLMFIGDECQIPFINRLGQCALRYSNLIEVLPNVKVKELNISFRCTLSTASTLSNRYKSGMYSVNDICNECSNKKFLGFSDVKKISENVVYLTFKQSEKDELIKKAFKPVFTVHEFQGKQEDHVIVIRISTKKEEIYSSAEHALVAFSRHRKSLTYYSPSSDDALGRLITSSKFKPIASMRKHLKNKHEVESPKIDGLVPENTISELVNRRIKQLRKEKDIDVPSLRSFPARTMVKLEGGACRPQYRLIEQPLKNISNVTEPIYSVVKKYRDYDVPTLIAVEEGRCKFPLTKTPVLIPNLELADISLLQIFYDEVLPGNSIYDYTYDPEMVQNSDIIFNLEDTMYNPDYKFNSYKTVRFDKLRPNLRTSVPVNRPNTQVESLLAMIKRNQSVADLGGYADIDALAETMLKRFNSLLKPSSLYLLDIYKGYKIVPNSVSVKNWLLTQSGEALSQIDQPEDILVRPHNIYNFMIKSTVKPQLDTSAPYSYAALQTIAYSDKSVNVNYCPMFRELVDRVLPMLQDHIVVNTGMAPDDLDEVLSTICRRNSLNIYEATSLEVDMSKYDKSQGKLMLVFEEKFLRQFGFDEEFIKSWVRSHERTILKDINNKIRCSVSYQRKSGDASTFTMNTFYLMAMLATLLPLEDAKLACFGGDDSLILGNEEFNVNLSSITAILFNMESKYFRNYKYNYFCSKFVLQDAEGNVKLIPDPVKLVTKLGRHDLANWEHLEEYRISLEDLTKSYSNAVYYPYLSDAVSERYLLNHGVAYVFPVIYNFMRNPELFKTLFYTRPSDRLCADPSVSKFD
ncbi:MAG: RNA-dependent RNA polymerase [Fushun naranga aenescens virga-like virus 1]|nr:MAG: RNA-dependent RNA polymerase [Fushun naranga aenescens virga-like virus 1]